MKQGLLIGASLLTISCVADAPPQQVEPPLLIQAALSPGYPSLSAPCPGPVAEPSALVVTSTDFNTGAVSLVELATMNARPDLALASSDALPRVRDGRVFVLNRYGFDWLDELDPADALALRHQVAFAAVGTQASANPQDLALTAGGAHAWVSLHGAGELQRLVFPTLSAAQPHADLAVDLSSFADADENPELSEIISCGELLFVGAARIDRGTWAPADRALLIPLDVSGEQPQLFDFDPDHPGADAITLLGEGLGPWRLAPDALGGGEGHVIIMLNSGLERVDLSVGSSEWLVDEQVFLAQGLGRLQLSAFDFDSLGRIWLSAAAADFSEFTLWRVELDGPDGPTLLPEIADLQSVTGALEIVGDQAWFADTTLGQSGLRVFDLGQTPALELPGSPIAVGLPPMSLAPL